MSPGNQERSHLPLVAVALLAIAIVPKLRATDPGPSPAASALPVSAVGTVGVTVSNLERSVDFYTHVLPFALISEVEQSGRDFELLTGVFGARARTATLRLGQETIALTEFLAPRGRTIPQDFRPNDAAFQHVAIIVSDMDRAYTQLRDHGVTHGSTSPQTLPAWNTNAGGIKAFYFKDPDQHFLEILQFPPDKGLPQWHQMDRLFLGLDHTAIVSTDTGRSLAFYRDLLGMKIAGESENFDSEQEHLNNVFGARLRITSVRAASGPGIELLEYLAPRTGRAAPVDAAANDLAHWQTTLVMASLQAVPILARQHLFSLVSPVDVRTAQGNAMLVRDPDAHALLLTTSR